ncbi:hypothetical protein CEXT_67621 [Caerostris extrusa]|uniref:Uncharacterized protein n=1 Tax=Caerostris extrusa TaxID=172846 RepID=A0AAV4MMM9_CAEEX|nr:hypothetical protein CEXT_67621 [Caerostris extrusa]
MVSSRDSPNWRSVQIVAQLLWIYGNRLSEETTSSEISFFLSSLKIRLHWSALTNAISFHIPDHPLKRTEACNAIGRCPTANQRRGAFLNRLHKYQLVHKQLRNNGQSGNSASGITLIRGSPSFEQGLS